MLHCKANAEDFQKNILPLFYPFLVSQHEQIFIIHMVILKSS